LGEVAKNLGAKVYAFKWINDFSAARNESIKYAKGKWIIWVDADEFITAQDMEKIKSALSNSREDGFSVKIAECREGEFDPASLSVRPKIFRNGIGIHFERPINEYPFDKDSNSLYYKFKVLDVPFYHWGHFVDPETLKKKKMRNVEILKKTLEEIPTDIGLNYFLAMNYLDLKMRKEALEQLDKVIQLSPKSFHGIEAKTKKAWIYYEEGEAKKAFAEAAEALKIDASNNSAWNLVGVIFMHTAQYDKARDALVNAEKAGENPNAIVVDLRQKNYVTNLLLSKVYLKLGKCKDAFDAAKKALDYEPTDDAKKALEDAKCQ